MESKFEDPLSGNAFPEAEWILRPFEADESGRTLRLVIVGSQYGLEGMKRARSYETTAHADERPPLKV